MCRIDHSAQLVGMGANIEFAEHPAINVCIQLLLSIPTE